MAHGSSSSDLPVISDLAEFDRNSGTAIERLVFNHRLVIIALCALATIIFGWAVYTKLELQAGFEKMLPKNHPYVINYEANKDNLKGLGNTLRLAVATSDDTIYTPEFMKILERVTDEVFFVSGVDRSRLKSLWTPNTRWQIVTQEGFEGGPVIPPDYDGSQASVGEVKVNVGRGGYTGSLVGNNHRSAAIQIPLMDFDPETGERLDYYQFSNKLETIRERFQEGLEAALGDRVGTDAERIAQKVTTTLEVDIRENYEQGDIAIHVTGFAKIIGEMIDGLFVVMMFFGVAVLIAAVLLYWYTRCLRSTLTVISVTVIAVVWQLGILSLIGYELDP